MALGSVGHGKARKAWLSSRAHHKRQAGSSGPARRSPRTVPTPAARVPCFASAPPSSGAEPRADHSGLRGGDGLRAAGRSPQLAGGPAGAGLPASNAGLRSWHPAQEPAGDRGTSVTTRRCCGDTEKGASGSARPPHTGWHFSWTLKNSASAGARRKEGRFGRGGRRQGQRHKVGPGKGEEFADPWPTERWATGGAAARERSAGCEAPRQASACRAGAAGG